MADPTGLIEGLEHVVRDYGVLAVAVILTLEALGAPVPGESLLIFSAVLAARGEMSLPGLLVFAWIGSVLGDNIGYLVGRTLGRAVILRYGAKIGLDDARFSRIEGIFLRYGAATVAFARFFNILRQLNGIVAGIMGMPWWRFLLFNALGAALWVGAWVFAASYLTEHLSFIAGLARHTMVVLVILASGVVVLAVVLLIRSRRRTV
jgi:membrane protein DedA with SNARE-associated domain